MDHVLLMLHLVAVSLLVRVACSASYAAAPGAADNGHTAKKSPITMDYSRYAEDVRDIAGRNRPPVNTCDGRYELRNSTIIRTKDSINNGADFAGDMKVEGPTECRWQCCQREGTCDTAIFVQDKSKDKNCFMFKCWREGILKCEFSSHGGYVSAVIGGFAVRPTSQVSSDVDESAVSADNTGMTGDQDTDRDSDIHQSEDALADNPEEVPVGATECRRGQIQCASGECIVARYVCNDVEDCRDGSDEMGCRYDTNTPSSHSSHATNLPQIGPTAHLVRDEEKPNLPQKLDLDDVRSELASELHGQSIQNQETTSDDQDVKGVDVKPADDKSKGYLEDDAIEDAKAGPNDEQYNEFGTGTNVESSKEFPSDVQNSKQDARAHPDTSGERLSGGHSGLLPFKSSKTKEQEGFSQANDDQRNLGPQVDKDVGERQGQRQGQMGEKMERLGEPDESHPSNSLTSEEQDRVLKNRYQASQYDDGPSKILSQSPVGLGDGKIQPAKPDHAHEDPGYNPPRNRNPSRSDVDNNLGLSDRFNPNYYRNDDNKDNLYSYDNYGTVYHSKPYSNPPDYNYHGDAFKDLGNPGQNYPDAFYDGNPLYPDSKEAGYDPDEINYHRRHRFNNYPADDRLGNREPSRRQHPYDGGRDGWPQRGGVGGMRDEGGRGGRPRVSGRPYQDRLGPDDGSTNDGQQNRPGAWKHWDEYNHHNTNGMGIQNGYDDESDRGDDRHSDTGDGGDGDATGDETPGEDLGGDDEEAILDDEAAGDGDNNAVATESDEELAESQTVQPKPKPTTQPEQPDTSGPETSHRDQDQAEDIITTVDGNKSPVDVAEPEHPSSNQVEPFGSQPATSAILPLAVGLIITLLLLMMLSCRLRYMNRRLRYGRLKTHAHDADYLINGMYL